MACFGMAYSDPLYITKVTFKNQRGNDRLLNKWFGFIGKCLGKNSLKYKYIKKELIVKRINSKDRNCEKQKQ